MNIKSGDIAMKVSKAQKYFLCLMMGLSLAAAGSLHAEEEFKAKLMTSGGPIRERMMNIKISVDDFTTTDDIQQMLKSYEGGDIEGFIGAFRDSKKGSFMITGGRGLNVRINVAHVEPTDEGRKLLLYMERQNWTSNTTTTMYSKYRFMMIELELDLFGEGTGKFYPGISIQLNSEGKIVVDEFTTPFQILAVQKLK